MHFLAHFDNVKKQMKLYIGSKKVFHGPSLSEDGGGGGGGGGLKLFGQCPYGNNKFQKGTSLSLGYLDPKHTWLADFLMR